MGTKIISVTELREIRKNYKKNGKKMAATSGCFDLLHAGHLMYLQEAAAYGDCLAVFLNNDASVQNLKGDKRPIVPQEERAYLLSGLEMVDYICLFGEETPCTVIGEVQPDYFIKGGDYQGIHIPEMDTVHAYGGHVEYVHLAEGHSTTDLIHKIMEIYQQSGEQVL